jgi:aspartate-semialdehyde dehydrogenase
MNRNPGAQAFRIAIVGAATLKGRELKDVLDEMNFPAVDVKLLDDDESLGQLEQLGDGATFIQPTDPEHFRNVDFAFFASDPAFTRRHWQSALKAGSTVIDLSYALDQEPNVPVRSPWIEKELERESGKDPGPEDLGTMTVVTAHPAATILALLLLRLRNAGKYGHVAASIFEPVSEQGKRGMDELHQQTVNLLSFQTLPKEVFDEQVAFNMLGRFGENSSLSLIKIEDRIVAHFETITGGAVPVPSLMLVQAPTFHAYTFSVYIHFEREIAIDQVAKALSGDHVTIVAADEDGPSNVGAAGQLSVLVTLKKDARNAKGLWIWAAADNLKIAAVSAVESASTLSALRPIGKVQ